MQDPSWALQGVLKRITGFNQGREETVASYQKRFLATTQVLTQQWGEFCPTKLAEDSSEAAQKTACEKFLSRIFLAGADKHRHGSLIDNVNDDYVAGKKQCPASADAVATSLSNCQDHRREIVSQEKMRILDRGRVALSSR